MKRLDVFEAVASHEKEKAYEFLKVLLDANEPLAMVAVLKRIAERKAFGVTFGRIDLAAAEKWQTMADALEKVEKEYGKSNTKLHVV